MHHRWHWLPISLVAAGVVAAWVAAACNYAALGWWQVLVYVGGLVALAGTLLFRRELSTAELEVEKLRHELTDEDSRLDEERKTFAKLQQEIEKQFEEQGRKLDKREEELASRLVAYHEWMDFPQPIDLNKTDVLPSPPTATQPAGLAPLFPDMSDEQISQLTRNDRVMMALLKDETKILYDNITSNKYVVDGKFSPSVVRDDAYELIGKVARIYQPEVEQPLLETNMPLVIRAASRACLHFLVLLDDLPLNMKDYSFNSLYSYVRSAVNAYRMYKSTEPYWPYVNTAYYLGRFAMGANPLTMGAWWFLGALGKQGAQAIATRVINRQALALLSDVVRVIGYEVASVYGGDFRHRDANWIYAAELTEMLHQFPLSRDSLSHALKEIGALQLRSEYDRIFLYRCIAAHISARPQNFRALACLSSAECRAIAGRLEKFLHTFIHGNTTDRVAKWKAGVETRLGVKLLVKVQPTAHSIQAQQEDAVRSLAGFLLGPKEREPHDLAGFLTKSTILNELRPDQRIALLSKLEANPPFFFEHPDLDPESDLVPKYLADLAALQVRVSPRDSRLDELISDVAEYLRQNPKVVQRILEKEYATHLSDRISSESPTRKAPLQVARAILDLLEPGEQARFLYTGISLEWPAGTSPNGSRAGDLWLLGAGNRLIMFALENDEPLLYWRADGLAEFSQEKGILSSTARLRGGTWLQEFGDVKPTIRITGPMVKSIGNYFGPLLTMVEESRTIATQA
ncbi:MAG: OmpH family outer membrane protein [Pirellulaceae bacterium]